MEEEEEEEEGSEWTERRSKDSEKKKYLSPLRMHVGCSVPTLTLYFSSLSHAKIWGYSQFLYYEISAMVYIPSAYTMQ